MRTKAIIFFIILILAIFGAGLLKKLLSPAPIVNQASVSYKKEDINRDHIINQLDRDIVSKQLNCQKALECWNKMIGKTLDGDNPIYAFDLDLNGDGTINQLDIDQINNAK